ncbi:MAG: DUF6157 family protein [Proteiniphilum sp.]|jgi:hypothetical protein|nr:DUF6157 family protein [Proteiniphilum sp.]
MHTTNYFNTFIEVSLDTKVREGTPPPSRDKKTVAEIEYELIIENPYKYNSDEILFRVYAERNNIPREEQEQARKQFFSTGQPCFRASPLAKSYGYGIHCNSEGKVAIYGIETAAYQNFLADTKIKKVKAMKLSREWK